jgi:hypothetical protein
VACEDAEEAAAALSEVSPGAPPAADLESRCCVCVTSLRSSSKVLPRSACACAILTLSCDSALPPLLLSAADTSRAIEHASARVELSPLPAAEAVWGLRTRRLTPVALMLLLLLLLMLLLLLLLLSCDGVASVRNDLLRAAGTAVSATARRKAPSSPHEVFVALALA